MSWQALNGQIGSREVLIGSRNGAKPKIRHENPLIRNWLAKLGRMSRLPGEGHLPRNLSVDDATRGAGIEGKLEEFQAPDLPVDNDQVASVELERKRLRASCRVWCFYTKCQYRLSAGHRE